MSSCSESGQMTIEAAFLVPVLFMLTIVMVQPAIILYDKMAMEGAAGQGLRMLAVRTSDQPETTYVDAIERQLEVVPDISIFREGDWDVTVSGSETTGIVSVTIATCLEPLPLMGMPMMLMGMLDSEGMIRIEVEASSATQPDWAVEQGLSPETWTTQWD